MCWPIETAMAGAPGTGAICKEFLPAEAKMFVSYGSRGRCCLLICRLAGRPAVFWTMGITMVVASFIGAICGESLPAAVV